MEHGLSKQQDQKTMNAFNEFLRFQKDLLTQGLIFEKKFKKFGNNSSAAYFPKRLIGKKFRVLLMPIDDNYEVSELCQPDKLLKATEKDLENVQNENVRKLI